MENIENAITEINKILKKHNCYLEISEWLSIYDKGNNKWKELDSDGFKLTIV
jgi:hypothetical protein